MEGDWRSYSRCWISVRFFLPLCFRLEGIQYPYHLYISPSARPGTNGPDRPFQCPTCGVRFTRIQNLKQHMLIHSGTWTCFSAADVMKYFFFHWSTENQTLDVKEVNAFAQYQTGVMLKSKVHHHKSVIFCFIFVFNINFILDEKIFLLVWKMPLHPLS